MEDNKFEMSRELEDMRQQFAVLKERFDRQEIVTDRILRETQKRRINLYDWLNLYGPIILTMIFASGLPFMCRHLGLPVWVAVMAVILAALSIIRQFYERMKYREAFRFEGNVLEIAGYIRNFRRRRFKMTIAEGAVSVLVLAVGCSVWLPNVPLTDDPFRWILFILLLLGVFAAIILAEVKSIRLLESIVRDLEQ